MPTRMASAEPPIESLGFARFVSPGWGNPNAPTDGLKRFAELVDAMEPGSVIMDAAHYTCFVAEVRTSATFVDDPSLDEGRGVSKQGVHFGDLTVSSPSNPPISTFVAVKPYDKQTVDFEVPPAVALAHDWGTMNHINGLSRGSAFMPTGVWKRVNGVPQMVTEYYRPARSLDNEFKTGSLSDNPDMVRDKAGSTLGIGNFGIGVIHGAGAVHRDAFPCNIAVDGRHIVFNDVTSFRPIRPERREKTRILQVSDVSDFHRGAFIHEDSSPAIRRALLPLVSDPNFRRMMYERYVQGAVVGARKVGRNPMGPLVSEEDHAVILQRVFRDNRLEFALI